MDAGGNVVPVEAILVFATGRVKLNPFPAPEIRGGLNSANPRDFILRRRRKKMAEICPSERKPSPALSCGVNDSSSDRTVAATISENIMENIPPAGPEASSAPVLPDQRGAAVGAPDDKGEPQKSTPVSVCRMPGAAREPVSSLLIQSYITNRMRFFGPRGR